MLEDSMIKQKSNMEFGEYQKLSRKTAWYPKVGDNYIFPILGLTGEAGEVANKIKKIERDDGGRVSEESKEMVMNELGDMIWYIAQLCTELDIDLEEVVAGNIQKIESKADLEK